MEKLSLILLILLSFFNLGFASSDEIQKDKKIYTKEEIIKGIDEKFYSLIPKSFSAVIESDTTKESISKIPEKAIIDKNMLKIKLYFSKELGVRVILEGVIDPFKNRFSYMEKIFDFIKPFNNTDTFFNTYEIFDIREDSFKLRKRGSVGTFLKIFFDNFFNIKKVQEYKDNKLVTTIFIRYNMIRENVVIEKIRVLFYEEDSLKILEFFLKDYDININVNEDIFLGYKNGNSKNKGFIC
ncbi:MAG TPA: hypothetical protein PKW55_02515 [Spirochaetota bacterium]|nr:hypothetical protein [Spirochaetota bacterium]HOM38278.1 hypothetical protein [Spirochaetota bacterium]HPQ48504.1 hypothetical protein [Spirochaetota bacterium]